MNHQPSIAHLNDGDARRYHPDGLVPWRPATPPDIDAGRSTGRLTSCQYCGSMHPEELAAAIKAGATVEWADRKYGWPHKVYVSGVPNPHAGMAEALSICNFEQPGYDRIASPRYNERTGERVADHVDWVKKSVAGPTTHGKFYSVHLQDATPEDREVIERAMGLRFTFHDLGGVHWAAFDGRADPEAATDTQDAS